MELLEKTKTEPLEATLLSNEIATFSEATEKSYGVTTKIAKTLWATGIFNSTAYIAIALQIESERWKGSYNNFDVSAFVDRWEHSYEDPSGKSKLKRLKVKEVSTALAAIEAADGAGLVTQIELRLYDY